MKRPKQTLFTAVLLIAAMVLALFLPLAMAVTATAAPILSEFATTGSSNPYGICAGPDGNVWFTEHGTNKVGKMKPDGTGLAEYPITGGAGPYGICTGPDGNIWFAEYDQNMIGRIKTDGTGFTAFPTTGISWPAGVCAGPDGNIWFAEYGTFKIGKIKTDGTGLAEYPVTCDPYGICAGPDGNVWFAGYGNKVGRIKTDGTGLAEYPATAGTPFSISVGPDNNLWYTGVGGHNVSMIKPDGTGMVDYLTTGVSRPVGICAGLDGNLWFTEQGTDMVGLIKPDGTGLSEYATTGVSAPFGICVGPDGNVWFAESGTNMIGRFAYDHPGPAVSSITANSGTQGATVSVSNLAGTGFFGTPDVKLIKAGGPSYQQVVVATNVCVTSTTKITCSLNLTGAPAGTYDVEVTTPDGKRGTLPGAFTVRAAPSPPKTSVFYFAEGTCRPNFDPYFCIQNPGGSDATVTITYMKGDGNSLTQDLTVPKSSRVTVAARDKLGTGDDAAHDFSAKVECTNGQQIIAERPMYFNYRGVWTGGHDVVGFTP